MNAKDKQLLADTLVLYELDPDGAIKSLRQAKVAEGLKSVLQARLLEQFRLDFDARLTALYAGNSQCEPAWWDKHTRFELDEQLEPIVLRKTDDPIGTT